MNLNVCFFHMSANTSKFSYLWFSSFYEATDDAYCRKFPAFFSCEYIFQFQLFLNHKNQFPQVFNALEKSVDISIEM